MGPGAGAWAISDRRRASGSVDAIETQCAGEQAALVLFLARLAVVGVRIQIRRNRFCSGEQLEHGKPFLPASNMSAHDAGKGPGQDASAPAHPAGCQACGRQTCVLALALLLLLRSPAGDVPENEPPKLVKVHGLCGPAFISSARLRDSGVCRPASPRPADLRAGTARRWRVTTARTPSTAPIPGMHWVACACARAGAGGRWRDATRPPYRLRRRRRCRGRPAPVRPPPSPRAGRSSWQLARVATLPACSGSAPRPGAPAHSRVRSPRLRVWVREFTVVFCTDGGAF